MELKIGNKIKTLRKKKGLTQEQLAENIGVSFQAVSKWENNIALPDITLVPLIAHYFGVSTDELLSYNSNEISKEIEDIVWKAARYRETDPEMGQRILKKALEKYPDNDILLNNLLYVMNFGESRGKHWDETLALALKLIDKTDSDEIRYDALRFVAYAYKEKGDIESAASALEQIPELYFTKLAETAFVLDGTRKYEAAEKQKWISFECLLQMMWKLAEYYRDEGDAKKAVIEIQRALQLIEAMNGEEKIGRFDNYVDYFNGQLVKLKQ